MLYKFQNSDFSFYCFILFLENTIIEEKKNISINNQNKVCSVTKVA